MISKKGLSKRSHLYVILDRECIGKGKMLKVAEEILSAGADMIQLRDKISPLCDTIKTGKAIKRIARKYGVPFIVNDRADVAIASSADGLHIGPGDLGISLARKLVGKDKLIGVTVKTFEQAAKAKAEGADYLGIGPVFKTPFKKRQRPMGFNLLKKIKGLGVPFFAIGGINMNNVRRLTGRGFKSIAAIRAVCDASDPYNEVKRLKKALI